MLMNATPLRWTTALILFLALIGPLRGEWAAGRVDNATWLERYDPAGFVTLCFQTYLGREPRPDEVELHVNSIRDGWATPEEILDGIATCPEAQERAENGEGNAGGTPETPVAPDDPWGPDPDAMPGRYEAATPMETPMAPPADGPLDTLTFPELIEERPPSSQGGFAPPEGGYVDGAAELEESSLDGGSTNAPGGTPRFSRTGNASLYARNALWDEVIGNRVGDVDGSGGFNTALKRLIRDDPFRRELLRRRAVVAINPADFSPAYARRMKALPADAKTIARDDELSRLATETLGMILWAETPAGLQPVMVMDVFQNAHAAQDLGKIPGRQGERWFVGDFHIGWLETYFGLSWDGSWKRVSGNLPEQAPRTTLHLF